MLAHRPSVRPDHRNIDRGMRAPDGAIAVLATQNTSENSTTMTTDSEHLYTRRFYQAFVAVVLFMTGVAMQFHFGQYIAYVGFGVDTLGQILSASAIGTLLVRLHLGHWIDRFGCKPVWLVGATTVAVSVATIQFTSQLWAIIALRTITAVAMAAVLTSVAVFAARIAPPHRRAESIGMLGLAGLFGIMVGPLLGDLIFSDAENELFSYRLFFFGSAACSAASGVVMALIPRADFHDDSTPAPNAESKPLEESQTQWRLIVRHWPGSVMLIGLTFSMIFCLQSSFLERLAEQRGFLNIKLFFLVYSPTAIVLRLIFRRLPEYIGRDRTVILGMMLLGSGVSCLIAVNTEAQLVLPGILMGAGHCFVFPSMVDLATERFPSASRGTGTALILGAGDAGLVLGFLLLGELIDARGFVFALKVLVGLVAVSTVVFAAAGNARRARISSG